MKEHIYMNKHGQDKSRCEGYTIYNYAGTTLNTPLLDMNGKVVHEWSCGGTPIKMLPGGSLLGRKRSRMGINPLEEDPPSPSGETPRYNPWQESIEFVQEGWDGQEEWSFSNWDDDGTGVMMSRQHHDFQREGNPVGYYAPGQEFVEKGKTLILARKNRLIPEISSDRKLVDDAIYEVDWNGKLTGFEWYTADHYDEIGFDASAREAITQRVTGDPDGGLCDWLHINSMSLLGSNHWYDETSDERFNPENIIISSRQANFVAIFSRVTGKIIWRIGPDFLESTPEYNLGQIVGQHHAHMIPRGLPGEGNILLFDNGKGSGYGGPNSFPRYSRDYSRVIEFNPVTFELIWQYGAESGRENWYSHNISAAQRLPNGNTLITDGPNGRLFEVTPEKENVWEFIAPPNSAGNNNVYRSYRIPPEWVPGNPAGYAEWAALYE